MPYETIRKPPVDRMRRRPNLADYEAQRRSFSWSSAAGEMAGLPGGGLNIAHECIDRHAAGPRRSKTALLWHGKNGDTETYTFNDLKQLSDRFAVVLRGLGVSKGQRVFVFLDRIPELYVSLFGALKCGAVVGPLFSAFGPDAIRDRLGDSGAMALVTSPVLLERVMAVRGELPELKEIILVDRDGTGRTRGSEFVSYDDAMKAAHGHHPIEPTSPEDWSIMHYTSGTTGKPKGAAHVHQAILGHHATARWVLDLQEDDTYWCTADPGWVTGTSYGMFGPWSHGVTSLVYEGGFHPETWYKLIETYRVTMWYTAPTALRMLMKAGEQVPRRHDLSSLRHICSVGEPLNPEAIQWGLPVFEQAIHDNWWQTETGCIQIANYAAMDVKPGSMGRPIPGTDAAVVGPGGRPLSPGEEGDLVLKPGWPSMFRTYWNKKDMYDSRFRNGWYYSGDRARTDEDGYFWFVGRADDVINTAGHLVGPFEVESALVEHPAVAEAGVIGKPDEERMEIVKAFVSLKDGIQPSEELKREIKEFVRTRLAAHAYPREIDFLPSLPKTRSGKIMRRLLKARELGLPEGDTSTLEE
ncbi:MAG TPA: acetate--CoA ligase [Candidatus Polarisedimenticolia bacterium]|nr:acetate--CoA ligase [Candidatus Polarisedimenticolia bacterium]